MSTDVRSPRIGDVVHYVLADGETKGAHRAGIVVNTADGLHVRLTVFPDMAMDGPRGWPLHTVATPYSADHAPGTWHWPEEEKGESGE